MVLEWIPREGAVVSHYNKRFFLMLLKNNYCGVTLSRYGFNDSSTNKLDENLKNFGEGHVHG